MLKANVKGARNWVGYYSPSSNRIITYDRVKEESEGFFESNTLIHEAAHQVAYNRGVHNRFGNRSSWITEGLACMFEAEGVYNRNINSQRKDRVNSSQLWTMQTAIKDGSAKGNLKYILQDDKLFRSNANFAYAYAWGLTFYLAETQPRAYLKFLTDDAKRPNFSAYGSNERLERFAEAFGSDRLGTGRNQFCTGSVRIGGHSENGVVIQNGFRNRHLVRAQPDLFGQFMPEAGDQIETVARGGMNRLEFV